MPKLVDYYGRVDAIREAVFTITLREGPTAINLPAVARELQMSLSSLRRILSSADHLPRMGLQWIEFQRHHRVVTQVPGEIRGGLEPWQRALNALFRELPSTQKRVDETRVWLRLVAAYESDDWARTARAERHEQFFRMCQHIVASSGMSEADEQHETERLLTLVEGMIARVAVGSLDPTTGVALVRRHVQELLGAHHGPEAAGDDAAGDDAA